MSKLTFTTLKNLVNQMKENNVDKDKFSFVYKVKFDVIVAIVHEGYELLVGLHTVNYGFVVKVNQNFVAELKEDDYYNLCKYLNLSFRNDGFTSNVFLKLLSSKIPDHYSGYKYSYKDMIPFLKCKPIDEAQKIRGRRAYYMLIPALLSAPGHRCSAPAAGPHPAGSGPGCGTGRRRPRPGRSPG